MENLAPVGWAVVFIEAANATAIEIAQFTGVAHRLKQRSRIRAPADRLADIMPERAHAHDKRQYRIEERSAEQRRHRIVRHQLIKGAGTGMNAVQHRRIDQGGKAEDEGGNAQCSDDADRKPVARKQSRQRSRPGIGGIGFGTGDCQRLRHVDVIFVWRRELAVGVAGAAGMTEIGEIVQIAVGEGAAHLHRRKHRAQALAIAAGIADRHQAVGLLENPGSVHIGAPFPKFVIRCGTLRHELRKRKSTRKFHSRVSPLELKLLVEQEEPLQELQFCAARAASRPAIRPNTLPMVMPMPAA